MNKIFPITTAYSHLHQMILPRITPFWLTKHAPTYKIPKKKINISEQTQKPPAVKPTKKKKEII